MSDWADEKALELLCQLGADCGSADTWRLAEAHIAGLLRKVDRAARVEERVRCASEHEDDDLEDCPGSRDGHGHCVCWWEGVDGLRAEICRRWSRRHAGDAPKALRPVWADNRRLMIRALVAELRDAMEDE